MRNLFLAVIIGLPLFAGEPAPTPAKQPVSEHTHLVLERADWAQRDAEYRKRIAQLEYAAAARDAETARTSLGSLIEAESAANHCSDRIANDLTCTPKAPETKPEKK